LLLLLLAAHVGHAAPSPTPTTATGEEQQRREQVELATLVATERLRAEVLRVTIADDLSAEQFASRVGAVDRLQRLVERAEQVGGPRWPEPQVCQVRVELSGSVVAEELLAMARDAGVNSPLTIEQLERGLQPMRSRVLAASGLSVSGEALERLPVDLTGPWGAVSTETRGQTVRAARKAAVDRAVKMLDSVSLPDGSKLGDRRRADDRLDKTVRSFLEERPVVPLGLDDDLTARVAVSVPVEAIGEWLRGVVSDADEAEFRAELAGQLRQQPPLVVGSAKAVIPEQAPTGEAKPGPIAPAWSRELILIEGEAPAGATRLQTIRSAEREAQVRLRQAVLTLTMPDGTTISEQVAVRGSVADAVERALALTNTARVTFRADGSASVQVVLDGRTLWQAIVDAGR
jgi:hypothetical protein